MYKTDTKKSSKEDKSDNFSCRKVGSAITKSLAIEKVIFIVNQKLIRFLGASIIFSSAVYVCPSIQTHNCVRSSVMSALLLTPWLHYNLGSSIS